ncbi:MAG: cellulase family glycosylhydrolase [Planctomycetota bacterium]
MNRHLCQWLMGIVLGSSLLSGVQAAEMPWVRVAEKKTTFELIPGNQPFEVWGVNYDHDSQGRLLEDYWEVEWPMVEAHFAQMEQLGANVVRVHLQLGKFMSGPETPHAPALDRLVKLTTLAENHHLYLNLTGLGCYHKADVPAWYDKLTEAERWNVQARFWKAVAGRVAASPAIFCYDLMNEPVVPGGRRQDGDWLGPAFAGKHFVQCITLDQAERPRPQIAKQWIHHLVTAIREVDQRHLITVGLVDWSLDRPGLTSGFVPDQVAKDLDFLCVHIYPERDKQQAALETLQGFAAVGKPVVIEETFPLKCSTPELLKFLDAAKPHSAGTISFYWGQPAAELRKSNTIQGAMVGEWLEAFEKRSKAAKP